MIQSAILLGLTPSFAAVTPPPGAGDDAPPQESFEIPQPQTGGAFTRAITGDFDGNGRLDVAVLCGGKIELIVRPGGVSWWLQTADTANDIAPRISQSETLAEEFVAVTATGARLCSLAVDTFVSTAISMTPPGEAAAWAGAQLVDSAMTDVGGSVEERIVGVMSDVLSLKTLRYSSGWISEDVTIDPATPVPGPIVALELVDIDGDQEVEIVLGCENSTACGVVFYELDGQQALTPNVDMNCTLTSLTSGTQANGSTFCAWTTKSSTGVETVYTRDAYGLGSTVLTGSSGVVGATTAAWTDDGHDDLVLSIANGTLQVLTNLGSTSPSFSLSNYTTIDPGPQSGSAEPAAGDVDGDGDEDLVLAQQADGELGVHRSATVNHWLSAPTLLSVLDSGVESAAMDPGPNCGTGTNGSNVQHLHTIRVSKPASGRGSTATHVAYTTWRRESLSEQTSTQTTSGEADLNGQLSVDIGMLLGSPASSGCTSVDTNVLYYYTIELQDRSGTETVYFPEKIFGVETQDDGGNAEHLANLRTSPAETLDVFFGHSPPLNEDPDVVGTLDRIREVPALPPGYTGQQ